MATAPILVFPDSRREFHVNVDVSSIELGAVLAQPGEGEIDHPLEFSSRNLSKTKINYTTIEREGLAMVYALQKFFHYLLGGVGTQKCRIFIHLSLHYSLHFIAQLNLHHTIFINTFGFHIIIFHFIHFSIKSEFMIKY
jgi:hypothetical protein